MSSVHVCGLLLPTLVTGVFGVELSEAMVFTSLVIVVIEFVLLVEFVLVVFVVISLITE